MYDQQQPDGAGDFVSLAVIDGYELDYAKNFNSENDVSFTR